MTKTERTKASGWTPRLIGEIYCSPLCGGEKDWGCTKARHDSQMKRAKALARRMGRGWKPHVWENLGWHYSVVKGAAEVHDHGNSFWVSIQGPIQFHDTGKDPRQTLQKVVSEMRAHAKAVGECIDLVLRGAR